MKVDINDWFSNGLITSLIPDFPYPQRSCAYCNKTITLVSAIHLQQEKEHYKALYICYNPKCEAYDEPAERAYARVYYSSQHAFDVLETHRIWQDQPKKR